MAVNIQPVSTRFHSTWRLTRLQLLHAIPWRTEPHSHERHHMTVSKHLLPDSDQSWLLGLVPKHLKSRQCGEITWQGISISFLSCHGLCMSTIHRNNSAIRRKVSHRISTGPGTSETSPTVRNEHLSFLTSMCLLIAQPKERSTDHQKPLISSSWKALLLHQVPILQDSTQLIFFI